MSWGRIDDGLHDHEKFLFFGPAATPREMWVFGMSWTHKNYRRFQAPGFVPTCMPSVWAGSRAKGHRFAAELVQSGLWEQAPGGWVFHDWLDYAAPDERAHFGAEPGPPPRRHAATRPATRDPGEPTKAEPDRDLSEKRREAGRRGAATTNSKRWGGRQTSANRRQKSASAESANVGKRRQPVGKPEPVADGFADPKGRQTSANPNPVEVQKPPPPTPSVITDLGGGGGGESPVPQAQTPTTDGPGDPTAADAVLGGVAAAWDRPVAALARHRDAVFSALMCGWQQDALARHLAADPPQPILDAAGLLADRLKRLPEDPEHCGRQCCAASAPPPPAVCITHHVPVGADGCEYCAVASGRCLRHPGGRIFPDGRCDQCWLESLPDAERAEFQCLTHVVDLDRDGTCHACHAATRTESA